MSLRSLGRTGLTCARLTERAGASAERWAATAAAARKVEKSRSSGSKRIDRSYSSSSRLERSSAASTSTTSKRGKGASKSAQTDPTAVAPSALSALLARLSLEPSEELHALLLTALTHPSYVPPEAAPSPSNAPADADLDLNAAAAGTTAPTESNELLAALGNSLLGLFASEHLATLYPNLPTRALKAAVSAHVGPAACFSVARELGIGVVESANAAPSDRTGIPLRWTRGSGARVPDLPGAGQRRRKMAQLVKDGESVPQSWKDGYKWEDVVASAVRAMVAIVFQEKGMHVASDFVHAAFLTRHVDIAGLLNFRNPKHVLAYEVRKLMAEAGAGDEAAIQTRLLAESGRHSLSPVYSVGLFLPSGLKLAEGYGSSMRMAEHRAAVNALHSIYTVRGDNLELALAAINAEGEGQEAASPLQRAWTLPTSLHTDYPLGASLRAGAGQATGEVISGTGMREREVAFEGRIGLGRSEVLAGSGRKWRVLQQAGGQAEA